MKPSGILSALMILAVVIGVAVALTLGGRARSLLLTAMTVGELVFITLAVPRMGRGSGTGRRSVWALPSATVLLAVLVVVTVLSWFVYAWERFTF